jgi:hypothetical protein
LDQRYRDGCTDTSALLTESRHMQGGLRGDEGGLDVYEGRPSDQYRDLLRCSSIDSFSTTPKAAAPAIVRVSRACA